MSSFLGAGQAGVGMVCLAAGISIPLVNGATVVAIATPVQKCVPLYLVLRGHTVALDASATVSLGTTGALTTYISGRAITALPSANAFYATCFSANSTSVTTTFNAAAVTVYASITQTSTAATILADLVGYLVP